MKWCVTFPEEDILIKRPCLRKACAGNKAAAAFLSYMLYRASVSQEYKKNAENINKLKMARGENADQDMTIQVYRTQLEIIEEMDNEISDRTLRDTAIPLLVALDYLEVNESEKVNVYTVHIDAIQEGLNHPPTRAELLSLLQQRIDSGSTSDKYRKYFRRLAELLPTSSELLPTHSGTTSDDKKRSQCPSQGASTTNFSQSKSRKSNDDATKREAEEHSSGISSYQQAAAFNKFSFETITEEEIALLQAYRQGSLQVSLPLSQNLGGGEAEQASKQAERGIQADEQSAVDGVLLEVPSGEGAGVAVEGIVQSSEPIGPPPVSENVEELANKHRESVFPIDEPSARSSVKADTIASRSKIGFPDKRCSKNTLSETPTTERQLTVRRRMYEPMGLRDPHDQPDALSCDSYAH